MEINEIEKLPVVDVAASGFEFICPACEQLAKLIDLKEPLECEHCHAAFQLGNIGGGDF